jgi:hypothetical protein
MIRVPEKQPGLQLAVSVIQQTFIEYFKAQ